MNKEQKAAIAHYKRMQKWVRTQLQKDYPSRHLMFIAIGEKWGETDCIYCLVNNITCSTCGLWGKEYLQHKEEGEEYLRGVGCCNGLWEKVNDSKTWGEWLEASKKVVKYIKKYG